MDLWRSYWPTFFEYALKCIENDIWRPSDHVPGSLRWLSWRFGEIASSTYRLRTMRLTAMLHSRKSLGLFQQPFSNACSVVMVPDGSRAQTI
jgi:hypothetical protein